MKSPDVAGDATETFLAAKRAKVEMIEREVAQLSEIESLEQQYNTLRSRTHDDLEQRAEAFFNGGGTDAQSLEGKLRKLHAELPLFAVEIKRRQAVADGLRGAHSQLFFAEKIQARDLIVKKNMGQALIDLAAACEAESNLVAEMLDNDCQPPAAYRTMKVLFVGTLRDQNSFINGWLRELRQYYPEIAGLAPSKSYSTR